MIDIYADGADIESIKRLNADPDIKGFTTNPSLMRKAGVKNYLEFAKAAVEAVEGKPISFEVLSDDQTEMANQATLIASLGSNVYVKIPVTTTTNIRNYNLMHTLSEHGIKVNATAITTNSQIIAVSKALDTITPSIISVFAGRIADTGRDPLYQIRCAVNLRTHTQKVLWASTREIYSYIQADHERVDIITIGTEIYDKMKKMLGRSLDDVSLDTVKMFYKDAVDSGFTL